MWCQPPANWVRFFRAKNHASFANVLNVPGECTRHTRWNAQKPYFRLCTTRETSYACEALAPRNVAALVRYALADEAKPGATSEREGEAFPEVLLYSVICLQIILLRDDVAWHLLAFSHAFRRGDLVPYALGEAFNALGIIDSFPYLFLLFFSQCYSSRYCH